MNFFLKPCQSSLTEMLKVNLAHVILPVQNFGKFIRLAEQELLGPPSAELGTLLRALP